MPLLTAAAVSDAVSLPTADDGQEGVVEMAVEHEAAAVRDARVALGPTVYAALASDDYALADPESADPEEVERAALYALYVRSVALLALVRVGPLALSARLTSLGGAQVSVGEGDRKASLMNYRDAERAIERYALQAAADLATLAEAVAGVSLGDDVVAVPATYVV